MSKPTRLLIFVFYSFYLFSWWFDDQQLLMTETTAKTCHIKTDAIERPKKHTLTLCTKRQAASFLVLARHNMQSMSIFWCRANLKCSLLGCKVIRGGIQCCNDAKPCQVCAVLPEGIACGDFWNF